MGKRIALFAAIVPTSCSLVFLASWGGAFLAPPAANAREEEERFQRFYIVEENICKRREQYECRK
jgi:hypothetical protein